MKRINAGRTLFHAMLLGLAGVAVAGCAQNGTRANEGDGGRDLALVYKARGSVQCEGRGVGPEQMSADLLKAGIQVERFACGHDGRMRAAMCGGATGELNLFSIAARDVARARELGFHVVAADATPPQEVECR